MKIKRLFIILFDILKGLSKYFSMLFRIFIAVTVVLVLAKNGVFDESTLVKWVVIISSYAYIYRSVVNWLYGISKQWEKGE